MPSYNKPPIVEAVIEFQFEGELDAGAVDSLVRKFKVYPIIEDEIEGNIIIESSNLHMSHKFKGKKLSNNDRNNILLLRTSSLGYAELAPYSGWDAFSEKFSKSWGTWRKSIGYKKVTRIGMRYINRLDIPMGEEAFYSNNYVNIYPFVPDAFQLNKNARYSLQYASQEQESDFGVNLLSSIIDSPVPRHISIVIDIDIFRSYNIPQKNEELFYIVEEMRRKKNILFESAITDRARELFK